MTTTANPLPAPATVAALCPFTVVIDSREQKPYAFLGLSANLGRKGIVPLTVPTVRLALSTGDYSIACGGPDGGHLPVLVERKSKEDLYSSVVRRANFEGRLERMTEIAAAGGYCAVVVECNDKDLLTRPKHCRLAAKSLNRTIIAWRQRYRVDWWFLSDRERAEAYTFRILERYYLDHAPKTR